MKVLLYTEGLKTISKSGLGKAIKHQMKALEDNKIDYTTNLKDNYDIDIKKVFDSWGDRTPKVHFSSPRNSRDYRSHSEYIDSDDFIALDIVQKIYEAAFRAWFVSFFAVCEIAK